MNLIDSKTIDKTAKLANLKLSDTEKKQYTETLSGIINYVEKISQLDTTDVKPTDHIADLYNVLREDVPHQSMDRAVTEKMAPQFENGHFVVPKIIE